MNCSAHSVLEAVDSLFSYVNKYSLSDAKNCTGSSYWLLHSKSPCMDAPRLACGNVRNDLLHPSLLFILYHSDASVSLVTRGACGLVIRRCLLRLWSMRELATANDLLFKDCDLLYNLLEVDEREFDRLFIQLVLKPFLADCIYFLRLQLLRRRPTTTLSVFLLLCFVSTPPWLTDL